MVLITSSHKINFYMSLFACCSLIYRNTLHSTQVSQQKPQNNVKQTFNCHL